MEKRIRIKDVAERAGVSRGTVDRVIHNRGRVAPLVKKRVMEVIQELGFERNHIASALAKKDPVNIVALMPNHPAEPYWDASLKGVRRAKRSLQLYGIHVEIHSFDLLSVEDFCSKAEVILQNPPDGLLLPPIFLKEGQYLLRQCKALNLPTIIFNTDLETKDYLSYIGQDSFQSGIVAARLLDYGLNSYDKVLILNLIKSPANAKHIASKERGFHTYFKEESTKDLTIIKEDFQRYEHPNELKPWMERLLREHPDISGIFVTNSRAHLIIDCLPDHALSGIKMVGFDLIPPNIKYLKEGKINFLINQNPEEQGFRGITTLFDHLVKQKQPAPRQFLPLDIVVKENLHYYIWANEDGLIL